MSEENKPVEVVRIPMLTNEAEVLLKILNFAEHAANLLAKQEISSGSSIKTIAHFNQLARDAHDFITVVTGHMQIPEPKDGQVH